MLTLKQYKISLVPLSTYHGDKLELIPRKNLLHFCIIIIKSSMNQIDFLKRSVSFTVSIRAAFFVLVSDLI